MSIFTEFAIPHVYRFVDDQWAELQSVGLQMFECMVCKALTLDFKGHIEAAHPQVLSETDDA
jgi:hypothetical protein